jgi:hypothetical protein
LLLSSGGKEGRKEGRKDGRSRTVPSSAMGIHDNHSTIGKKNIESLSRGSVTGTTPRLCFLLSDSHRVHAEPTLLETTQNAHNNYNYYTYDVNNVNNSKAQCIEYQ